MDLAFGSAPVAVLHRSALIALSFRGHHGRCPLEPAASGTFADRLNPRVEIDGQPFVLITQELVTVRTNVLGQPCGSIAGERDAIINALDLLSTGF
jgi:hypothetical protein